MACFWLLLCNAIHSDRHVVEQNFSATLMNWDVTYWAQKQQQALFNLTDEEVRPYFAYDNVLKGLFEVRPQH